MAITKQEIKVTEKKKSERSYLLNELLNIFGDNLVSVVLFGSYARKNYTENSDLDILIITKDGREEEKELQKLVKEFAFKFGKKLDIQVFSQKDVIRNFNNFSPLFSTFLLGKVILFDREMFFERLFRELVKEMINQDIKYCEGGKIWELKKIAKSLKVLQ